MLLLLVDRVIAGAFFRLLLLEPRHQLVDLEIQLGVLFGRAGNDQRRARFVDEDGVDFVDDGEGQLALHAIVETEGEVVAQVVEAEFVVGAVGDVAGIGGALFGRVLLVPDDAHGEPEEAVDGSHPVRVALRQVLVDRDDVDAIAGERVEIRGQRRHERLAFAGAHLGDAAVVEGQATDELHVEVPHPERALRGLAHHAECFRRHVVERLAGGQSLAEFVGLGPQGLIAQCLQRIFEAGRLAHRRFIATNDAVVATAEEPRQEIEHLRILAREELKSAMLSAT